MWRNLSVVLLGSLWFSAVTAIVDVNDFFPFGVDNGDTRLPAGDDTSSGVIQISTGFPFFAEVERSLWVNVNGAVSFANPISQYTPHCVPLTSAYSMISPFWTDIDTQFEADSSYSGIFYRETTSARDLAQLKRESVRAFPDFSDVTLRWAFVTTWFNVTNFHDIPNSLQRNTFQLAFGTDGVYSFVVFYYNQMLWPNANISRSTQVGFDAGDGVHRLMFADSCTLRITNVNNDSNVDSPGTWVFRVDSADIVPAGCQNNFTVDTPLTASPAVVSWFGYRHIDFAGPCLNASDAIICIMGSTLSASGVVIGNGASAKIRCPMPTVSSPGMLDVQVVVPARNASFFGNVLVQQLAFEGDGLQIQSTDAVYNFSWSSTAFSNSSTLQLAVFYGEFLFVYKSFPSTFPNSGFVTFNRSDLADVYGCQFTTDELATRFWVVVFDIASTVGSVTDAVYNGGEAGISMVLDLCPRQERQVICQARTRYGTPTQPLSCPPLQSQAESDPRLSPQPTDMQQFFHPTSDVCFESPDRECCYRNATIDCRPPGGYPSFHELSSLYDAFVNFTLPRLLCCYDQDADTCASVQKLLPCDSGRGYVAPGVAHVVGDSHFVSWDNTPFTFNGKGEFWLLRTPEGVSDNDVPNVQVRLEPTTASGQGSVVTGVVLRWPDSTTSSSSNPFTRLQVEFSAVRKMNLFANGVSVNLGAGAVVRRLRDTRTLIKVANNHTDLFISTRFFGCRLTYSPFGLSVSLALEQRFANHNFSGLLGNFNGNPADDLTNANGTRVPVNASLATVHAQFGLSWMTSPQSTDFLYRDGQTWATFNDPAYAPLLSFDPTQASSVAKSACGSDYNCLFDFTATNNQSFAILTRQNDETFASGLASLQNAPAMCPVLEGPQHGFAVFANYLPGAVARFGCELHYRIQNPVNLTCTDDLVWVTAAPTLSQCVLP